MPTSPGLPVGDGLFAGGLPWPVEAQVGPRGRLREVRRRGRGSSGCRRRVWLGSLCKHGYEDR